MYNQLWYTLLTTALHSVEKFLIHYFSILQDLCEVTKNG